MKIQRLDLMAIVIALLWGWSEAVWFFLIPDVWLTFCVFRGARTAILSVLAATIGAMIGALTIYALPHSAQSALHHWWTLCPGYYAPMFSWIGEQLQHGASGLLAGPTQGVPYRFFVYSASQSQMSLASILAWTPIARLPRMLMAPAIAGPLLWLVGKQNRDLDLKLPVERILVILFLSIWTLIYIDYWFVYLPARFPAH